MNTKISKSYSFAAWVSCLVLILCAIGITAVTASDKKILQYFFLHYSYYAVSALFLIWTYAGFKYLYSINFSLKSFIKNNTVSILVALLLCVLVFLSVQPYFRVLSDETNLLSISKSMLLRHSVENVTQAKWDQFDFFPIEVHLPKRPFVFPYVIHLLHLLFGFNPAHAFAVNFLTLWTLLSAVLMISKKYMGRIWSFVTVLLILAQPVVTQTAASGSFDLFFALFFILSLIVFARFVYQPTRSSFAFLWMQLLMLSNIRYEGPVYFVLLISILIFTGCAKKEHWLNPWLLGITPLLSLPILWQRFYFKFDYEMPAGREFFSAGNFVRHAGLFLKEIFHFDFYTPYAGVVNFIGLLGFFYIIYYVWSKSRKNLTSEQGIVLAACVSAFLVHWIILNSLGGDTLTDRDGSRLWTLSAVMFSIMAAWVLYQLGKKKSLGIVALVFALAVLGLYHPVSIENRFANSLNLPREHRSVLDFLKKYPRDNSLLIAYRPGIYTAMNYAAVNFKYANYYKSQMTEEISEHYYRDIFVLQEIISTTGKPTEGTRLDPEFKLEKVYEIQDGVPSDVFLRISKVVN